MSKDFRGDSSTEFGSDPILIDRIRIESATGSNPILIVQIRIALDRAVDFNERVTAFTTGRACKARGYAYAKIEYVSVRAYLSKNRIRTLRILEPWCAPISDIKGGNADIQLRCRPAHN